MSAAALETALAAIEAGAPVSNRDAIQAGAEIMLAAPWRIARVLGEELPPEQALVVCRRKIAGEVERGRAGHYSYEFSRLVALRQAERALETMVERRAA